MELVLRLLRGQHPPLGGDDNVFVGLAQMLRKSSYGALFLPASLLSGPSGTDLGDILISLGSSVDVWLTADSSKLPEPEEFEVPQIEEEGF